MARDLMMSNIVWDYYFKSNDENGVLSTSSNIPNNNVSTRTITVGDLSENQIIEVTFKKIKSDESNSPQMLICSSSSIGIKVHVSSTEWLCSGSKIVLGEFNINTFVTIRIEKINKISNVYFNGELKAKEQVDYQSGWNTYNGVQYTNDTCYIKEIKYKKL